LLSDNWNLNKMALRHVNRSFRPFMSTCVRRQYSQNVEENDSHIESIHTDQNHDNTDEELQKLCDISRLPGSLKGHTYQHLKMPTATHDKHFSQSYLRRMYAHYGSDSGIHPGVMWPTSDQFDNIKEFTELSEPTLQELQAAAWEERGAIEEGVKIKEELMAKNMAKMPEYINLYKQRLQKQKDAELKVENKRKALLEEAREFFGYHIDPRDPRFLQMQEMKAEEEIKMKKLRKREEREAKKVEAKNFKARASPAAISSSES